MVCTEELTQLRAVKKLPSGQKVLLEQFETTQKIRACGFPIITEKALEKRFCCDLIQRQHALAKWKETPWGRKLSSPALRHVTDWEFIIPMLMLLIIPGVVMAITRYSGNKKRIMEESRCRIKYDDLEYYSKDIIPPRCYANIERAQQNGILDIKVAYPVMEDVVKKDPVIVGTYHGEMYEIDMWE